MTSPELQPLDFALTLMHSRYNILPRDLLAPGPTEQQLHDILGAAAAAPDHRQLRPWRFVLVPQAQRARLAEVFGLALLERDANASAQQLEQAREKAHRAPFLMLAVARLGQGVAHVGTGLQPGTKEAAVSDAERLVSFGCAIQNIVLAAHAAGFGTGLTSGQALHSARLRTLFRLEPNEQAVCCINIGTPATQRAQRLRPAVADYVSQLS
ncbi:MAG: nitroreductase family protein [Betaproteobacteria bacterium]